jgi:hypothetical protein
MKRFLVCGLLFFSCSIVQAELLSSTAYIWPIPHGSEGALSVISLDGGSAHGEINAGVLQVGQTVNFNTTDNTQEGFLTSDLTNDVANGIELHFGSNVATVDELSLVNQVPRLSAFDFAGYDISGYSLTFTSLAPGQTFDNASVQFVIYGGGVGGPLGGGSPEPATFILLMAAIATVGAWHRTR